MCIFFFTKNFMKLSVCSFMKQNCCFHGRKCIKHKRNKILINPSFFKMWRASLIKILLCGEHSLIFFFFVLKCWFTMPIFAVYQSDSIMHTYTFFLNILHHGRSQETVCNSLCYTVWSYCLSSLHVIVSSNNAKLPVYPSPSLLPLGNHSLFSMSVSLLLSCI